MADFRRVVTALAVVVLFVGLVSTANAQPTGPAFGCTAQAAVPPLLRAEGLTELTGDVVLNCTGGVAIAAGAAIPTANFAVFLGNTQVTSRIYDSGGTSEALLLVDEPTTTINPSATFIFAPSALTGCAGATGGCVQGSATLPNVYRGIVSGNSVTFIGVPVAPPGSTGTRIYRITNVRANASTIGAGPGGTPGQVQAFVSVSGSTSVPITNPTQIVGFVQNGLAFSLRKVDDSDALSGSGVSKAQCNDLSKGWIARARYAENFATAFKTQIRTDVLQNIPGAIYNTESGLVISDGTNYNNTGKADSGTRLRATFNNIPAGTTIYVSTTNVVGGTVAAPTAGVSPYAVLIASETAGNVAPNQPFTVSSTTTITIPAFTLVPVNGTAVAVWEVTAASDLSKDNYDFLIGASWTGNAAGNSPAAGVQGTVSGSFAPAPPAISATDGAKASTSLPIPRFIDSGSAKNLIIANICRTNLLFPFVTNQAGFDTGLAIANTTTDIYGTTPQTGNCVLNFFGANAPAASTPTSIASGTVQTWLASSAAPNFQGYVIAQCNFQYGHGFAFVSDVGARNLAMGYLALVLDEPGNYRGDTGESLGQ